MNTSRQDFSERWKRLWSFLAILWVVRAPNNWLRSHRVNGGHCWSLKKRLFVGDAISYSQKGRVSPRAFCCYNSSKDPSPKFFQKILENSLDEQEFPVNHFINTSPVSQDTGNEGSNLMPYLLVFPVSSPLLPMFGTSGVSLESSFASN